MERTKEVWVEIEIRIVLENAVGAILKRVMNACSCLICREECTQREMSEEVERKTQCCTSLRQALMSSKVVALGTKCLLITLMVTPSITLLKVNLYNFTYTAFAHYLHSSTWSGSFSPLPHVGLSADVNYPLVHIDINK